jgi:hypothetical protein
MPRKTTMRQTMSSGDWVKPHAEHKHLVGGIFNRTGHRSNGLHVRESRCMKLVEGHEGSELETAMDDEPQITKLLQGKN